MGEEDEARMSIVLPVEAVSTPRPQPWVLHLLNVNTMNFCAFGSCEPSDIKFDGVDETTELLISVPNTLESESVCIASNIMATSKYSNQPSRLTSTPSPRKAVSAPSTPGRGTAWQ